MNFKYILTILISVWALTITSAFAEENVSNELGKLLESVKTMQASFKQSSFDNKGKAVQQSYGRMAIMRPGKFRWQVEKPIPQLIVVNGSRIWIYDADLEQVTIRKLATTSGEAPALLLSQEHSTLEQDYNIKRLPESSDGLIWFSLEPRKKESMFTNVQMAFANNQIQKFRLLDHLGHNTLIEFSRIQKDINLPANLFEFKAPSGVDVIDETRKG